MSIKQFYKKTRLIYYAKRLRKKCHKVSNKEDFIKELQGSKFSVVQIISEISKFASLVEQLKPQIICDIGSARGGTIRLFSHFAAPKTKIISIDLDNTPMRQAVFPHLIEQGQRIDIIQASSYDPSTVSQVKQCLNGQEIDLLFIDGDHSYQGVAKDFECYSPLVRKGGIIGLHDIIEDYKTRYGKQTPSDVGEVPKFWKEIKTQFSTTKELVEDTEQDGFGIGAIFV
ncbi:MAG: class I SAM-dependent methyltransferase [Thermoplasmatales archaeon]|nr:class I SAM-dependent methyltransferase [Thermoplasmatales archaeon]